MSTGELRQRNAPQNRGMSEDPTTTMASYDEAYLSARSLLAASPAHSSPAMKMHIPAMYAFLPATVRWFLSRCCPRGWSPQWKRRHLIALGGYLYRFKDENGSTPKGSPIPVATVDARILSNDVGDDSHDGEFGAAVLFELMPEGCHAIFEISSIGKTQYFAVESTEEATTWVNSLRQMRQDAITRNMGHSRDIPYPKEWKSFDTSARRVVDQKRRIRTKLEVMNKKEQEMQTLGGGGMGGSAGMGFFG